MERGVTKVWKGPSTGKKAAAPLFCHSEGRLSQPLQVHVKVYKGQRVCAGLGIFTNCSVVVFISFIPAVAPEPFWQLDLPG